MPTLSKEDTQKALASAIQAPTPGQGAGTYRVLVPAARVCRRSQYHTWQAVEGAHVHSCAERVPRMIRAGISNSDLLEGCPIFCRILSPLLAYPLLRCHPLLVVAIRLGSAGKGFTSINAALVMLLQTRAL